LCTFFRKKNFPADAIQAWDGRISDVVGSPWQEELLNLVAAAAAASA
jgi:hypothetical protein